MGAPVGGLFERKGCEVAGGGVRGDHVHACVRIPPRPAVSDVMGCARGKGAMVLRDRHPERGGVVGKDKAFWARGHCVSTVGLNEETIRRYVAEQEDGSRFEQGGACRQTVGAIAALAAAGRLGHYVPAWGFARQNLRLCRRWFILH